MTKDYPRMRRFWWILFSIINGLWMIYGAFALVVGLIVDPALRWAMLGALAVCGLFFGAVAWKPTHDFAMRHSIVVMALGAAMVAGGLYCLFQDAAPPSVAGAGIFLLVGGTLVLTMPMLLRQGA